MNVEEQLELIEQAIRKLERVREALVNASTEVTPFSVGDTVAVHANAQHDVGERQVVVRVARSANVNTGDYATPPVYYVFEDGRSAWHSQVHKPEPV